MVSRLYLWDETEELKWKFEFISYRDPFPRTTGEVKNDPIVKLRYVIDEKDFLHAAVLRNSGHVDLYYNYQLV